MTRLMRRVRDYIRRSRQRRDEMWMIKVEERLNAQRAGQPKPPIAPTPRNQLR